MKNLLAKIKSVNYKQALIEHGEKLVLGLIGLFVVTQLGFTSWARYDKQPKEFQDKVESGQREIQNSLFTLDEQNKYKPTDIMQQVQTLQSPLEPGRYQYSTDWFWPMYPIAFKCGEPKWLALIEPIADFGKAVIVEQPPQEQSQPSVATAIDGSEAAKKLAEDDDDEFAVKGTTNDATARGGAGAGAGNVATATINGGAGIANSGATASSYKNLAAGGIGGMNSMMGKSAQSAPTVNSRGNRFISVRGIFPLGDQLEEMFKTMHEQKQQLAGRITFLDFDVERQVAQAGDKTWSGPWEKVDLQATLDLLDRIELDADLVDPVYTDNVFTMPLPRRIGRWKTKSKDWASHPLIKTLTDAEAELQAQLNNRLVEEAEKKKVVDKTSKKGFASRIHDVRGLRSQFSSQMQGMSTDISNQMKQPGGMQSFNQSFAGAGGMEALGGAMNSLTEQMDRTGNGRMSKYLLFRYFDFQVTPGNAYRYRVRLTLLNPNFKRAVEELVDESIAAGEVRVTPWSEPTPHVFVPEEQRIFLAKAEKSRSTDTGLPSAHIDVYQWFAEAGTTIAAKVEKLQLGQFIGGLCKETEVFRPANDTLNKEDVPVFTGSLLADVAAAPTAVGFDPAEHADLKLDEKKLKQLTSADKALIVDRYGQLAVLDTKTATDDRSVAEGIVENERRLIRERLKDRPAQDTAGGDLKNRMGSGDPSSMMGSGGMMMSGMGAGNSLKKDKKSSATKKAPAKGKTK